MNLIEQQNILRGLPDDELPKLAQSGETPPFLVLSEINRRKQTRERYEGERAKYAANNRSVAEELMGGGVPSRLSALAQQHRAPAAGIDAVAPLAPNPVSRQGLDAAAPEVPAFADGGYVADYLAALEQQMADNAKRKDEARAMALIAAGAGMMGGKSSNAFTNIGQGIAAALPGYQSEIRDIDSTKADLLQQQFEAQRLREQDARDLEQTLWTRTEAAADNARMERQAAPAAVQEALWYESATPEQRASYDKINSVTQSKLDKEAEAAYNTVYRDTRKRYYNSDGTPNYGAIPEEIQTLLSDPKTVKQAQEKLDALIKEETLSEYIARYPSHADYAEKYQAAIDATPAGASGAAVVPYTDFFK